MSRFSTTWKRKAPTTTYSCNIHDVCSGSFPAYRDGSAEISGRGRRKKNKKKTIHCRYLIWVLCVFSTAERKKYYFILMACYRKAKIRPGLSHIVTLNHTVSVFFSFRLFYYYLYTVFRYYFFFFSLVISTRYPTSVLIVGAAPVADLYMLRRRLSSRAATRNSCIKSTNKANTLDVGRQLDGCLARLPRF